VVNDHAAKSVGRRLVTKMAADVSDAKPPLRGRVVRVRRAGRMRQTRRPFGALGLETFRGRVDVEIEGKGEAGVNVGIVWPQRKCIPQIPDRIFRSPEIDIGVSAIKKSLRVIRSDLKNRAVVCHRLRQTANALQGGGPVATGAEIAGSSGQE